MDIVPSRVAASVCRPAEAPTTHEAGRRAVPTAAGAGSPCEHARRSPGGRCRDRAGALARGPCSEQNGGRADDRVPASGRRSHRAAARAARSPGRAGRNLPAAIAGRRSGSAAWSSPRCSCARPPSSAWSCWPSCVGVWEMTEALAVRRHRASRWCPVAVGAAGMLVAGLRRRAARPLAVCFALTAVASWSGGSPTAPRGCRATSPAACSSRSYTCRSWPASPLLLRPPRDGQAGRSPSSLVTVGSDTGGYAAGVLFGKHPMAPSIRPKKSWEGFAGSVAGLRRCRGVGAV